jgi:hypothetical protein
MHLIKPLLQSLGDSLHLLMSIINRWKQSNLHLTKRTPYLVYLWLVYGYIYFMPITYVYLILYYLSRERLQLYICNFIDFNNKIIWWCSVTNNTFMTLLCISKPVNDKFISSLLLTKKCTNRMLYFKITLKYHSITWFNYLQKQKKNNENNQTTKTKQNKQTIKRKNIKGNRSRCTWVRFLSSNEYNNWIVIRNQHSFIP